MRIVGELSECGVRQKCIMALDLFYLYAEITMRQIKALKGFIIGGVNINNLRYPVSYTEVTEVKLQKMRNKKVEESKMKELTINRRKSFAVVFSKKSVTPKC